MTMEERVGLARQLQPLLRGDVVGLAYARETLHAMRPDLALQIDGMEASRILRWAGFTRDYSRPVGAPLYRRNAA